MPDCCLGWFLFLTCLQTADASFQHPCPCRICCHFRRAHENSAIMGAAVTKQMEMLKYELLRRIKHPLKRGGLLSRHTPSAISQSA